MFLHEYKLNEAMKLKQITRIASGFFRAFIQINRKHEHQTIEQIHLSQNPLPYQTLASSEYVLAYE